MRRRLLRAAMLGLGCLQLASAGQRVSMSTLTGIALANTAAQVEVPESTSSSGNCPFPYPKHKLQVSWSQQPREAFVSLRTPSAGH